jgi:hypothetical protein
MSHGGLMLSDLARAGNAQTISALRQFTTGFHDLDAATGAGYGLLTAPPATAQDGCISDDSVDGSGGGMGYHYTRGNNLGDDAIDLLDPEFLVYAPTDGPPLNGVVKRRLAAVEYFIPFSQQWPEPGTAGLPDDERSPRRGFHPDNEVRGLDVPRLAVGEQSGGHVRELQQLGTTLSGDAGGGAIVLSEVELAKVCS